MGKLIDLAKALGSELGVHSRLGRWILAASSALDAQGGDTPLEYIQVGFSVPQTVAVDTDLLADQTLIRSEITYAPLSGIFRLKAGKKYRLVAHGRFNTFSADAAGVLTLSWVDGSNVEIGVRGIFESLSSVAAASNHPVVEAFVDATEDINVKLRCVAATGNAITELDSFSLSIVELR